MSQPSLPVRVAAVVFVSTAAFSVIGSVGLGFYHEGNPGPGLLPLIAGGVLLPLAVALLVRPSLVADPEPFRARPLVALASLLGFGLVLPFAGFVPSSIALVLVWMVAFYRRSALVASATSVALVLGAMLLFGTLLGVQLPLWPARP